MRQQGAFTVECKPSTATSQRQFCVDCWRLHGSQPLLRPKLRNAEEWRGVAVDPLHK